MKAVAVALVLIAGAAVILWYGNTLNSLVLGGLIGGLAALLLSIPISLTIFSYLSRRQDEQHQREEAYEREELSFSHHYQYPGYPERHLHAGYHVSEVEYEEEYGLEREIWEEERHRQLRASRQLPAPRLSATEQDQIMRRPVARNTDVPPPATRQPTRGSVPAERRHTPRRMNHPGFPGYQEGARSQYQSQALRAARKEAAQQFEDEEVEVLPTYVSKRFPAVRPDPQLDEQDESTPRSRLSRHTPRQGQYGSQSHRGDISPTRSNRYFAANDDETTQEFRYSDPQTDSENSDLSASDLRKPLIRRAPYMYDDDDLRQELLQQVDDMPKTRRSSRKLPPRSEE